MIKTDSSFNRFLAEYRLAKFAYQHRVDGAPLIELLLAGYSFIDLCRATKWDRHVTKLFFSGLTAIVTDDAILDWSELLDHLPLAWVKAADDLEAAAIRLQTRKKDKNAYLNSCAVALRPLSLSQTGAEWITHVSNRILLAPVMLDCLANGHSGIRSAFGFNTDNPFELYDREPELMRVYSNAFSGANNSDIELFEQFNDLKFRRILDVGGGSGSTLVRLMNTEAGKDASGVIYDFLGSTKTLAEKRRETLGEKASSVGFVDGDFLAPGIGLMNLKKTERFDLIILGWILHDWPNKLALRILKKLKVHLRPGGKLFVLEDIKVAREEAVGSLIMFLMMKGQERTQPEFEALFKHAGFQLQTILRPRNGVRSLMVVESV